MENIADQLREKAAGETKTAGSEALFGLAQKSLAGGVSADGKRLSPHPIYVEEARGAHFVDVDGNQYVDFQMGAGAHILGHGHDVLRRALHEQIDKSIHPSLPTRDEISLAEAIQRCMPHMERLRFANSGTEAVMAALRLARAVTGRPRFAKFEGNYHGQHDSVLFSGNSGAAGDVSSPTPHADCAGIPTVLANEVLILPFNDLVSATRLIDEHWSSLAAIIVEPVATFASGAVPAEAELMVGLRRVCDSRGILLIWDEVVTGFRVALGGMAERLGFSPDLSVLGKIIGGGMPIGAFGGRADVMEAGLGTEASPNRRIFHSGTFTGNPMAMTAGRATIQELERLNPYSALDSAGNEVRSRLSHAATDAGIAIQVTGLASIFHVHFADFPIRGIRDSRRADLRRQQEFSMGLIDSQIYLAPNHPGFISTSHTDADLEALVTTSAVVFKRLSGSRPGSS